MKLKTIIFTFILLFAFSNIFSQDKVSVYINNKKAGETIISENPVMLSVNKMRYKNLSKLVLKYTSPNPQAAYKRSIEVTDENENPIYSLNETKGGLYNISLASIRKKILALKTIKVFMMENPVNERMSIPSRRKLLIELHLK